MSKKVINLGKVKGRTLDLKVDNKVLKKKYDDETEWQELGKVGGIDTVNTVNDLPADAEKDDIAFVKEAAFVETVEYQEEIPIVLQGGQQILNIELRQKPLYLSEINLNDFSPELKDAVGYAARLDIYGINGETSIMAISYSASVVAGFLGIEQPADVYQITHYGNDDSMTQYHRLQGMSIKDYMMNMSEIPATEEQMQILLGEHYNDKTEDNPSYEWFKASITEEPLNEQSVFLEDNNAYVTLEFDIIIDLKGISNFVGYNLSSVKMGDEGPEEDFYIEGDLYDIEDYEKEEQDAILKFGNILINTLYSGGLQDVSYDVYTQKGFHKFDKEWKNLEEEMNIPKVVETHSDLPKSFIENGLMAVANEEIIQPEPTNDFLTGITGLFEIKGQPDIQEEVKKIKQFFITQGASADLNWEEIVVILMGQLGNISDETNIQFAISPEQTDNGTYCIFLQVWRDSYYATRYFYFDEAGAKIELPQPRGGGQTETYAIDEGGCWYYYDIYDNGKNIYLDSSVQKMKKDDWFSLSNKEQLIINLYGGFSDGENGDEFTLQSYEPNFMRIYDSSKIQVYPQGFYKYSKNRWYHQPNIAGASFDNEDILKQITDEDLGNITENTEARHTHNNKSVLDQLPWDSYDKLANQVPKNTSARHTHDNFNILNSITSQHITDLNNLQKFSNKEVLDNFKITHFGNEYPKTIISYNDTPLVLEGFNLGTWETLVYSQQGGELRISPEPCCIYDFRKVSQDTTIIFNLDNFYKKTGIESEYNQFRFYVTNNYDNGYFPMIEFSYGNVVFKKPFSCYHKYDNVTFTIKKDKFRDYVIDYEYGLVNSSLSLPIVDNYYLALKSGWEKNENASILTKSNYGYDSILFPKFTEDQFNVEAYDHLLEGTGQYYFYYYISDDKNFFENNNFEYYTYNNKYYIKICPKTISNLKVCNDYLDVDSLKSWDGLFNRQNIENLDDIIDGTLKAREYTSATDIFSNCLNLKRISSKISFQNLRLEEGFTNLPKLEEIEELDLTNSGFSDVIFSEVPNLKTIGKLIIYGSSEKLRVCLKNIVSLENITVEGAIELTKDLDFSKLINLTKESAESIINVLYSNSSNTQYKIYFSSSVYDLISQECKELALNKNILVLNK